MRPVAVFLLAAFATLVTGTALAAAPDDIVGLWLNEEKDANIEVYKCADKYCGKIVWMQVPNYPEGSADGTPGTPKLDHLNPDPAKRKNPRMGLTVVKDMEYYRDNRWHNGEVYDPKSGKTYSAEFTLADPENLDLRGYIGIKLFGRTSHWTRKK